jgi:hypothetical protein
LRFIKLSIALLVELWPLAISGLLFLVAKSLEWAFLFPEKGQIIDYWFMVRSRSLIFGLTVCILPTVIVAGFIWVFVRISRNKQANAHPFVKFLAGFVGIGILLYTTGLMCVQSFSLAFKDFGHFQSTKLGNHVYYVDSIWVDGVWQQYSALFALFECDEAGTFCQDIYEKVYEPDAEEYKKMTTALIPDPAAHTVTLQIDGETVYVYPVK